MMEILTEIVNLAREVVNDAKSKGCEKYLDQDDVNHMLILKLEGALMQLEACPDYAAIPGQALSDLAPSPQAEQVKMIVDSAKRLAATVEVHCGKMTERFAGLHPEIADWVSILRQDVANFYASFDAGEKDDTPTAYEAMTKVREALKDLLTAIAVVFDDERLDYVDAQVSKAAIKDARAATEVEP